jgi:hypothetical protein
MANLVVTLPSRLIRNAAASGGTRTLVASALNVNGDNSLFSGILSIIGTVLTKVFGALSWSFTAIWGFIVSAVNFIYNFNWNITDEQVNAQINQTLAALTGLLGQATGRLFGTLACGALPATAIMVFAPEIGTNVVPKITDELLANLAQNYASLIQQAGQLLLNTGVLWLYSQVRRAFIGSDDALKARLTKSGVNAKVIAQTMANRGKPFVIAQKITEKIDSIKDGNLKSFVNRAYAEFGTACIESGYVVAGALDEYFRQKNLVASEAEVILDTDQNGVTTVVGYGSVS